MKASFFSGCYPEKIKVEFYPIFFREAKTHNFSKLKLGCRSEEAKLRNFLRLSHL
jgi:hypothetical protein